MTGPERAVDVILSHLAARVPGRLAAIRALLALPAGELPDVASWHHPRETELLPVEEFPAVMVAIYETTAARRVAGTEWAVRYRARVYVFARGEGAEATGRARARYLLACREAMLAGARAPLVGPAGAVNAPVDERTYRESFSELDAVAGGTVGAAYLEAELTFAEELTPSA